MAAGTAIAIGSALASAYGAHSQAQAQKKAAQSAADSQSALGAGLMRTPGYVRRSKKSLFGYLDPIMQQFQATGKYPQVLGEDWRDKMYDNLWSKTKEDYDTGRSQLTQSLTKRGLADSTLFSKAVGDYDDAHQRKLTDARLGIETKARLTNYGALQDVLNKYMSLFSKGKAQQGQSQAMGAGLISDALGAGVASAGSGAGSVSQLAAALAGMDWSKMYLGSQPGPG